jgi:amino acid transporter
MPPESDEKLIRGVGVTGATALNMIDMIGVGPFITMPLIIAAMGGPQAMLGWIFGAVLVMCDGLVWAELGASMPKSGGPYYYLKEIYGERKLGRLMSFLFIWQLTLSRRAVWVLPSTRHTRFPRSGQHFFRVIPHWHFRLSAI